MRNFRQFIYLVVLIVSTFFEYSNAESVKTFAYASRFYKIQLSDKTPLISYFSVDALGKAQLRNNPIKHFQQNFCGKFELNKISDTEVQLLEEGTKSAHWTFKFKEKAFTIASVYLATGKMNTIDFLFDQHLNYITLLGWMTERKKVWLPAILHLPDMGTFQLTADQDKTWIGYDASRKKEDNFISIELPGATVQHPSVTYRFTVKSIFPSFAGVKKDKFAGYRRNYLNLFQVNPKLGVLANNTSSDPCAFTLFMSSILALYTPPLVGRLTALNLLQMSLERYLGGMKAYGLVGYKANYEGFDSAPWESPYNSLDSYPSLVISACNYIKGSKNLLWAKQYYPKIKEWMDIQMKRDYDKNGLVEYELCGNSGSWNGKLRPANWWDTIGYGHEDAFSNALTYGALCLLSETAQSIGIKKDALHYYQLARKLKTIYYKTFFNPQTGILAGWKSKDGKLHDYYFVAVNSLAIYFKLVPDNKVKSIMTILWKKMQEEKYVNFRYGIPGNLIPVRREDYTNQDPRWGGGQKDNGNDAFQRYENGGASLNWSYFVLKAFQKAGLNKELKIITNGILDGINAGDFQGSCDKCEMTKDWKNWKGECWGYEGYLCDGYLVILALNPKNH